MVVKAVGEPSLPVTVSTILLLLGVLYLTSTKREGFFGIGGKAKQETTTNVTLKNIREKVTEISKANQVQIEQFANNNNTLVFEAQDIGAGCLIDLSQSIKASQSTVMAITDEVIDELNEQVSHELDQKATAMTEKKSDAFGAVAGVLGGGTNQETNITMETEIKDLTKKTFNTDNMTEIEQAVVNENDGNIKIRNCVGGTLKMHQEIVSDQVTDALIENLTKNIMDSKYATVVSQDGEAVSAQEDTTVSSVTGMISGIMQGYSMMYAASACASACVSCACVLMVGIVLMGMDSDDITALAETGRGVMGNFRAQ